MNNWIFVIRDDEIIFKKRIEIKKWPIFHSTKFRKFIEKGDEIIFYQAGQKGQKFLGTASIKSEINQIPDKMDYYVDIEKIHVWENPLSIRNLISKLDFIKNKEHWGLDMQGGVLKVDKNDFSIIIKESKKKFKKIEN